nr:NTP transferase domain-containing protein [uncultured Schaedlerella sp.]
MKAIILAAGKGNRLGQYTKGKPKCLLMLGKESILSREIRILQECGFPKDNIYVVGGYRYELLKPVSPNLIYNPHYDTKDNSYSLGFALEKVFDDDVLVLDADLCFDKEVVMDIVNDVHENVLLSKKSEDLEESTGIVTEASGKVTAIGKKYMNTGYVYISIFKVGKYTIPDFRRALLTEKSMNTWYTLAITEVCKKHPFYNRTTEKRWHEIDFIEDYMETLKLFQLEEG